MNDKIYIGSSRDLRKRKRDHFNSLRRNTHSNLPLQNSYNKYGRKVFKFNVLFYCAEKDLLFWEQALLDYYGLDRLFNVSVDAQSPMRGLQHSPETLQKISKSSTGRRHTKESREKISRSKKGKNPNKGCKLTAETKRRMSLAQKGNQKNLGKKHSDETKRKMSEAAKGNTRTLGHKFTDSHKEKLSISLRGKNAKLDIQKVILIRYLRNAHRLSHMEIASLAGVSVETIRKCVLGITWSYIAYGL